MIDYYKKMSQNQIFSVDNKLSDNWKPHPFESDIFINVVSNEQVQRFYLQLSKGHDVYFQKRMQENHPSIVKVRYFHVLENKSHSEDKIVYVYVDRMLPVNRSNWIPINTALSVLKGFRRLSSIHGFMRVNQKMISMNEKG